MLLYLIIAVVVLGEPYVFEMVYSGRFSSLLLNNNNNNNNNQLHDFCGVQMFFLGIPIRLQSTTSIFFIYGVMYGHQELTSSLQFSVFLGQRSLSLSISPSFQPWLLVCLFFFVCHMSATSLGLRVQAPVLLCTELSKHVQGLLCCG